ncbi:hypothetical protein [Desulfuribacillus alkaliarsenatis]|uniref:Lipoprotein n=1 Tax=Desulfuribacillus alkaliarsenatis TaxID=766136 RepID=A0A1E5FZX2_9FIRM|nr:hypothetical protein [Desulfuribacillus alkaliarsenatis]OEF96131.1 hypothetical protein BHF68_10390 [Desulfuribacillus alkaliarsenatis]
MKKLFQLSLILAIVVIITGCTEEDTYKKYIYKGESEHWTAEFIVEINPYLAEEKADYQFQNAFQYGLSNQQNDNYSSNYFDETTIKTQEKLVLTYKDEEGLSNNRRIKIIIDTPFGSSKLIQGTGYAPKREFVVGGGGSINLKKPYRGNETITVTVDWSDENDVIYSEELILHGYET